MARQIPPLSLRDAYEKYECGTVAKLRPARKCNLRLGFRWGTITEAILLQQLQLMRFDGKRWVRFGDLVYDE
jgi:hypothetical protein